MKKMSVVLGLLLAVLVMGCGIYESYGFDYKQNGMIHPTTGLPITSHQAALIDMSNYKGNQNVRIVRQKGHSSLLFLSWSFSAVAIVFENSLVCCVYRNAFFVAVIS